MEEQKRDIQNKEESIKKSSKFKKFLNYALIICLILFCFSGFKILQYTFDARANKKLIEKVSKSITVDETIEDIKYDNIVDFVEDVNSKEVVDNAKKKYRIDFETLKEENSDTVGFLKVKGTDVEFIVVQTVDNDYYLTHNFEKSSNKAGWIFADFRNKLDGSDRNIVIYGHNMLNGSMFSSLSNVLEREWFEDISNRFITFITEDESAIYQVFAVYQVEDNDYYTTTNFSDEEFKQYLDTALENSIYGFDTNVKTTDQILTLITCGRSNSQRIVINAKKLN